MTFEEMRMSHIYGRRRVGESELVKQAVKESGIKSLYYECKQVTEASNVQSICDVVSETLDLIKETGLNCYKYVFFSRAGFTEAETDEIKHIELRKIFS
ncbi:MAG: hypothetical protein K6F23_15445 [Solobacterium sp.]|nr:hypothetical protein [Solobacterium sp.]